MKPCEHAKTCATRIADGDRPGGCDELDEASCPTAERLGNSRFRVHIERLEPPKTPTPFAALRWRP